MSNMYIDVATFLAACDQKPSEELAKLYNTLMNEEYTEFLDAVDAKDEVESLDACMDLIWVTLGYCISKGYDVNGAWNEVARSNLDKIDRETGKVQKREDGKVLKPAGWRAPDLTKFL